MKMRSLAFTPHLAASTPNHIPPSTAGFGSTPKLPKLKSCSDLRFRRCCPALQVTFDNHKTEADEDKTGVCDETSPPSTAIHDKIYDNFSATEFNLGELECNLSEVEPNGSVSQSASRDSEGYVPKILGIPTRAILALNAVAIIWGTQHAVIKLIVDDSGAGPFTLLRFGIGAIIASVPLFFNNRDRESDYSMKDLVAMTDGSNDDALQELSDNIKTVWRWGAEMGFWLFLGFAFQAIGLATTTAQRSGFLLYLNVKLVPFFAFILFGRQISIPTWTSALIAFAGTALLAYDGTSWNINQGDLWSMAAAAASAMYILRIGDASEAVGEDNSIELNAACLWVVTALSTVWSMNSITDRTLLQQLGSVATAHPLELIYLSGVTTALANYIQTKSQRDVTPERASVIYSMDPVYGAIFSNLLLGESLTSLGLVGAGMITAAAATNAFLDLNTSTNDQRTQNKESGAGNRKKSQ